MGYAGGNELLAAVLTVLAINARIGTDFSRDDDRHVQPASGRCTATRWRIIWFGLGASSLVFVLVHSVLWAVALNTRSGLLRRSRTLRMVGADYGLSGFSYSRSHSHPGCGSLESFAESLRSAGPSPGAP